MFHKILIANRGEIAVRIGRACQEMGIRTVAVYSEADSAALFTRVADEAVLLGPPPPRESYLDTVRIIEAARSTGCEAIHPGYGFLSENADFAEQVRHAGLVFIGPSPEAIQAMGSKTEARSLMRQAGVPIVPGYQAGGSLEQMERAAEELGYPVLVKAAAGGGGKGMRVVREPAELRESLESARREAENAFGDGGLYLEKYLEGPRHVEFQVLADTHGHTIHLFERECSIQRRHQKIVEESPSPLLDPELRERMGQAAVTAAQAVGYVNAGTIEFLVDTQRQFYFLEMNTRLQVEHPITEAVAGIDLVKAQIRIAAGERLPFQSCDLIQRGHAIECRIYAEDADHDFLPATGRVLLAVEPQGPGIRVDAGVGTGDLISHYYDPMIAKLIVSAESRLEAIRKMDWALSQYTILGVTTNLTFLRDIVNHPLFRQGEATTHFVDEYLASRPAIERPIPDEALIAAALSELIDPTAPASSTVGAPADADLYNPWRRTDSFRLGGGAP